MDIPLEDTVLEPQIDTIQENSESITINVTDEAGNSISEELTFESQPKSPPPPHGLNHSAKTLPREARLFNDINEKFPRSISATAQLKLSSPPIRRRDLKPSESSYLRSKTPNSIYLVADEIRRKHENNRNTQKRCTSIPVNLQNKMLNQSQEFKDEYQKYNQAVIQQPELIG